MDWKKWMILDLHKTEMSYVTHRTDCITLWYLSRWLIGTSSKIGKTKVLLPVTHFTIIWNSTWIILTSWPLKKGWKGPAACVIERSRREINLPWLQEFIITTFSPGTFFILYTVRPQGFESSSELLQIKAVETGSLRLKDINPITFEIFTLNMLPIRAGWNHFRYMK